MSEPITLRHEARIRFLERARYARWSADEKKELDADEAEPPCEAQQLLGSLAVDALPANRELWALPRR